MIRLTLSCCAALALAACSGVPTPIPDAGHEPLPDAGPTPDAGQTPDAGVVTWETCTFKTWPDGYPKPPVNLQCTTLEVPIDRAQPSAGTMPLRVARQPARKPTTRAVFQLAGGPGGSAVWEAGVVPLLWSNLLDYFDVIYVDQRGTGGSGYLDCSKGYPQTQADWTACAAENATQPLQHYLTVDAAQDVETVRQRLGYAKASLHGGSYGTRVGLEYARLYPEHVAAAVLDGVLPPDVDDFAHDLVQMDSAVARVIADCAASAACLAVSPSLQSDLEARKQALAMQPRPITIDGQAYQEDVALFEESLYAALDWTQTYYSVPRAIHAAATGDESKWDALLTAVYGVPVMGSTDVVHRALPRAPRPKVRKAQWRGLSYVSPGLFEVVSCAEYLPNASMPMLQTLSGQQQWMDAPQDEVGRAKACGAWNVAAAPASVRTAVSSDARVLLLSGDIDFRTPKAWGEQAKQTLPNGTHVVVPFASHEAGTVFDCPAQLTVQYLVADGDLTQVDASCVQTVTQPAW